MGKIPIFAFNFDQFRMVNKCTKNLIYDYSESSPPEAEPVEAVGTENVDNLPSRRLSLSKPAESSIQFQIELISDYQ